jgi:uncharacterized RDD family membrane protein YckC
VTTPREPDPFAPPPQNGQGQNGQGQNGQPQYPQYPQQPQYPQYGQGQYGQGQYGQGQYGQQPPAYGAYLAPPAYSAYQGPQTGQGAPASMGNRLLARIIDALIVGVPAGIVIWIILASVIDDNTCTTDAFGTTHCTTNGVGGLLLAYLIFFVAAIAYEIYFIGVKGATIGKRAMGIRVVDAATGAPIGAGRAFVRYLVLAVTGSICTLGYWSPFFDNTGRYQGWHDKAANDFVVVGR